MGGVKITGRGLEWRLAAMALKLVDGFTGFSVILKPFLIQALNELSTQSGSPFTPEQCSLLMENPPSLPSLAAANTSSSSNNDDDGLSLMTGYPLYPLCNRLTAVLAYWMINGCCPVFDLPVMFLLNETAILEIRKERIEGLTSKLKGAYSKWDFWSDDEKKSFLVETLQALGARGVLDLLSVRQTVGSVDAFPPSRETLLDAFVKPHCPRAKLTVGARALAKHHHRDDTTSWWGKCTGSEDEKNKHALQLIYKILDIATWINIHCLPHDLQVVEMRTTEGYGARWLLDGMEFRGFLEPQMKDGHAVGWRH